MYVPVGIWCQNDVKNKAGTFSGQLLAFQEHKTNQQSNLCLKGKCSLTNIPLSTERHKNENGIVNSF